jgi:hypothetical protein
MDAGPYGRGLGGVQEEPPVDVHLRPCGQLITGGTIAPPLSIEVRPGLIIASLDLESDRQGRRPCRCPSRSESGGAVAWAGQHPLPYGQVRQDVVGEMGGDLGHTPGVARGADPPPLVSQTTSFAGFRGVRRWRRMVETTDEARPLDRRREGIHRTEVPTAR